MRPVLEEKKNSERKFPVLFSFCITARLKIDDLWSLSSTTGGRACLDDVYSCRF